MNYFCCDCTNKFFIYTTNYFSVVLRITFPMCIENYFFIGPRINFRGIANLFFVLLYIAALSVHFENFASGGVFAKRIPRRNIVGERNERGFHLFLQNLKGVLSSMQKWWGFLDRGFDRGDYAERLQDSIVHISAQMTSPLTCKHRYEIGWRPHFSLTFRRNIRNMLIIRLCNR